MESVKTWRRAFEVLEPYIVKITSPQGSGTGFLVASTDDRGILGIATAAHVVDFPHYWRQPIRVEHCQSGETVFLNAPDRVIDIDYDRDVAALVIEGGTLPFPEEPLQIIGETEWLKVGVEVGWMGFPAIAQNNLCFFSGRTSCWVADAGFYFVDGVAINGVSGGPTFYLASGGVEVIGIVSAYVPNRATGAQLPGLCVVRDALPLYKTIRGLKDFGQAKRQETQPEGPPPAGVNAPMPPSVPPIGDSTNR